MKIYDKYILPKRLNKSMGSVEFNETRKEVAEKAIGTVLEIGFGSGYSVPFYKNIKKLYALEPSEELYNYSKERVKNADFPIEYLKSSAEKIPLPTASIDTIISTWTLCSIPNLSMALAEINRVMKSNGTFVFVEHGRSPKRINSFVQILLTPITKHFTGNCHLDREIDKYISDAGFEFQKLIKEPEDGRPLMFSYEGVARKNNKTRNSS